MNAQIATTTTTDSLCIYASVQPATDSIIHPTNLSTTSSELAKWEKHSPIFLKIIDMQRVGGGRVVEEATTEGEGGV